MSAFAIAQPTPEMLSSDDRALAPGLDVIASIPKAKAPIAATVHKVNAKSVEVRLSMDCEGINGKLLYPSGATVKLPRIQAANDDLSKGYVLKRFVDSTPTLPAQTGIILKPEVLVTFEAQKARLAALQAETAKLAATVNEQEQALITAWEAGARAPENWECFVNTERTERITPKWKDEALDLAEAAGQDREAYEAGVRARTKPSVSISKTLKLARRVA